VVGELKPQPLVGAKAALAELLAEVVVAVLEQLSPALVVTEREEW
jgi:hypothetical protein